MSYYCPVSIVNESALEAVFEYGLINRPDVLERADLLARNEGKELTVDHIVMALRQKGNLTNGYFK